MGNNFPAFAIFNQPGLHVRVPRGQGGFFKRQAEQMPKGGKHTVYYGIRWEVFLNFFVIYLKMRFFILIGPIAQFPGV